MATCKGSSVKFTLDCAGSSIDGCGRGEGAPAPHLPPAPAPSLPHAPTPRTSEQKAKPSSYAHDYKKSAGRKKIKNRERKIEKSGYESSTFAQATLRETTP